MEVKKWQARKGDKELVKEKQRKVQKELRQTLGINVYIPRSWGSGNSHDGNIARTFFKCYKEAARVLGVDGELIRRFYIILCVLSSNKEVDPR